MLNSLRLESVIPQVSLVSILDHWSEQFWCTQGPLRPSPPLPSEWLGPQALRVWQPAPSHPVKAPKLPALSITSQTSWYISRTDLITRTPRRAPSPMSLYNGCNTSWENDNISSIGSSPGLGFIMGSPAPSPLLPQLPALLPQFLALPLELVAISLELMALMARRPATPLPSLPVPYLNGAWESQQLFSVCHSRTSYQKTRNWWFWLHNARRVR